ncbi:alpha/beta hydrolase [Sodalis ligni]|uniref:Acetyl esterase/lipase n=1 Tax=Sodalis ligni TaxID=2697027 RepID=A0A4R1NEB0_9GAMM|nr:alpha/beta hydrolase [Sodalis ligni]TCL05189.1 acetyl esterase/lipase [Sodalis ligni]
MSHSPIAPERAETDRQVEAFLKSLNAADAPPVESLSPQAAREVLIRLQKSVGVNLDGIDESEQIIVVDGQELSLNIVRPAGHNEALPAFMFFRGGGWVMGDYFTHKRLLRDLVVESGAAGVFVNYTPSPQAQYPTAIQQAYGATRWVAEHGAAVNIDGSRLAVAGNSVGGNMATVVSLMAKEHGRPSLKYQVLFWPVTNADFATESYQRYPEGYFLTKGMMEWFWDNYTTDPAQRREITASPLQALPEQLAGLPPALVQVAECDVLKDEGIAYARKLNEAGVDTTLTCYYGLIHDFGLLNPLQQVPGVRSALLQAAAQLKKHLF